MEEGKQRPTTSVASCSQFDHACQTRIELLQVAHRLIELNHNFFPVCREALQFGEREAHVAAFVFLRQTTASVVEQAVWRPLRPTPRQNGLAAGAPHAACGNPSSNQTGDFP